MSAAFYDDLAPYYHLLYADWEEAISHQGQDLATLLHRSGVEPGELVLDAACGIGTQTIGLLNHGYRMEASDTSQIALDRLNVEASAPAWTTFGCSRTLRLAPWLR